MNLVNVVEMWTSSLCIQFDLDSLLINGFSGIRRLLMINLFTSTIGSTYRTEIGRHNLS